MQNNNCDGSGPHTSGTVKLLPTGTTNTDGNLILCQACFNHELQWRAKRNIEIGRDVFKLPVWEELKEYN